MQALRHASRRALRATEVMQEPCIAFTRACSSEAAPRTRLSREERHQLACQYIEKFKAANNGELPTLSLMRKEVGGSYDVLKQVIQEFEKGPKEQVASEGSADVKKSKTRKPAVTMQDQQGVKHAAQESSVAAKDGGKKKTSLKEKKGGADIQVHEKQSLPEKEKDLVKDEKSTLEVLKSLEEVKSSKEADAKLILDFFAKQKQPSVPTEDTLDSLAVTFNTDEDDDDDSDVAAPEYGQSSIMQMKEGLPQAKEDVVKVAPVVGRKDDQSTKSKVHLKEEDSKSEVMQLKKEDRKSEVMQKGLGAIKSVIQSMPKPPVDDKSSSFGSKPTGQSPPTTVLRIVNLPAHTSAHQLKSLCESVAKVHGVSLRRGRIADVQFDVEMREMNSVLERLRRVPIGNTNLKVFPALRFSCENKMSKPQDVHQFKHVRNGLLNAFEQRFKFLCFQVQDFRELHNLKVAK